MEKKYKLGVIGAGFMSSAIISGAISSKVLEPSDIIVSDKSEISLEKMSKKGVTVTENNLTVANSSEFVLFAVKPQNFDEVANSIKISYCHKFITIMAGVKKAKVKSALGNVMVARCMPNTPCSIGFGAIGIDVSDYIDENDRKFIQNLFSSLGKVRFVDESLLNAVTGISGSSPAYFYLFLKGIIESGVKNGLSYDDAKTLATATMLGSAQMVLKNEEKTLDDLITAVCSKGGTTIEAINVYKSANLDDITDKAVKACISRAAELENL